jgi:hypothetical protein
MECMTVSDLGRLLITYATCATMLPHERGCHKNINVARGGWEQLWGAG